jgi:homoserine O-acetyltransferase
MNKGLPIDSVGLVDSQIYQHLAPIVLASGQSLSQYQLVFETYGTLNTQKNNAILVCHALSGSHHAAGFTTTTDKKPGWWDAFIGPGKVMDTNQFFIVCPNNLGSCYGSTGPKSINPETQKPFGLDFPKVMVEDWVMTQAHLSDFLGIDQWAAVIGGSLGGMQALQWAIQFPTRIKQAILLASAPSLSAQNIAFNEIARQSILSDPDFNQGQYYEAQAPKKGLTLARMLGHVTYLSDEGLKTKFDRELKTDKTAFDFDVEFQVESYLRYQGKQFSEFFDANTYLLMTKALDYFDPAQKTQGKLDQALANTLCDFLVVSFSTDWRFSPKRSEELVQAMIQAKKNVSYAQIETPHGHDGFLIPIPEYLDLLRTYFQTRVKNG